MAAKSKPNELHLTRVYDAPVKAVWDAWTDPAQSAHWWGPRGFTTTNVSKDVRPGGIWRFTMHGPDGTDWPTVIKYLEVEKYSRLVYDHGGDDKPAIFRVTVTFAEENGRTRMEMTMALPTVEAAVETRKRVKQHNGNSTWDRLAEFLEHASRGKEKFVINRSFAAPIERVYAMWVDPEHLARWLPPTGLTMSYREADIRAGGSTRYLMTDGGETRLFGRIDYLELGRPHRLVYTQQFCDEQGKLSRHPKLPTWPATMRTTVTFSEEGSDETRVTVEWEAEGTATREELAAFVRNRGDMTQGWTGSFNKLEELLAGRS